MALTIPSHFFGMVAFALNKVETTGNQNEP